MPGRQHPVIQDPGKTKEEECGPGWLSPATSHERRRQALGGTWLFCPEHPRAQLMNPKRMHLATDSPLSVSTAVSQLATAGPEECAFRKLGKKRRRQKVQVGSTCPREGETKLIDMVLAVPTAVGGHPGMVGGQCLAMKRRHTAPTEHTGMGPDLRARIPICLLYGTRERGTWTQQATPHGRHPPTCASPRNAKHCPYRRNTRSRACWLMGVHRPPYTRPQGL
jgi:hypothetical protein